MKTAEVVGSAVRRTGRPGGYRQCDGNRNRLVVTSAPLDPLWDQLQELRTEMRDVD